MHLNAQTHSDSSDRCSATVQSDGGTRGHTSPRRPCHDVIVAVAVCPLCLVVAPDNLLEFEFFQMFARSTMKVGMKGWKTFARTCAEMHGVPQLHKLSPLGYKDYPRLEAMTLQRQNTRSMGAGAGVRTLHVRSKVFREAPKPTNGDDERWNRITKYYLGTRVRASQTSGGKSNGLVRQ